MQRAKNMKRRHNIACVVYAALAVAMMVAIFYYSAQSATTSSALSDRIALWIALRLDPSLAERTLKEQMLVASQFTFPLRKSAHMSEYAILAIFISASWWHGMRALCKQTRHPVLVVALAGLAIAVAYACTDELHQLAVDGRSGQAIDVAIDSIGAAIGVAIASIARQRVRGRQTKASSV